MTNRDSARAIALAAIVVLSMVAGTVTFAGTAAATHDTTLTVDDPSPGVATNHSWYTTIDQETSGSVDSLRLNYSDTGTNLSRVGPANVFVGVANVVKDVDAVTTGPNDEVLEIQLNETPSVAEGDLVGVELLDDAVDNPPATGSYEATLSLLDGGSVTIASATGGFEIATTGSVSGTVTNATSGDPVTGATVQLWNGNELATSASTDGSGAYTASAAVGQYDLVVSAEGYYENAATVTLEESTPKTVDLALDPMGAMGTVTGTVTNASSGATLEGAYVDLVSGESTVASNVTDSNGEYSLQYAEGQYDVVVFAEGYDLNSASVALEEGTPKTVDVALTPSSGGGSGTGTLQGQISDADTDESIAGATVSILDGAFEVANATTDANGNYAVDVATGAYDVEVAAEGYVPFSVTDYPVWEGTNDLSMSLSPDSGDGSGGYLPGGSLEDVTILEENLTVVSGAVSPDSVVLTNYTTNLLGVRVEVAGGDQELAAVGADENTEFRIDLTVENFTPSVLIGTGRGMRWEYESAAQANATDVTIWLRPASAQYLDGSPDLSNWPENDTATFAFEQMADVAMSGTTDTGADVPSPVDAGMVLATDAQTFTDPWYDEAGTLRISIGGPHLETDGVTVNDGFFEGYLPKSLLDQWGVTAPTDLTAVYQENESAIEVTESAYGPGYDFSIDVHYSAGEVAISAGGERNDDGDSGGSGGSGFVLPPPDSDDGDGQDDRAEDVLEDVDESEEDQPTDDAETADSEEDAPVEPEDDATADPATEPESDETPGFGLGVAMAALLGALALRFRFELNP